MASFGSDDLQAKVHDMLKHSVENTEFEITEELKDTKRLQAMRDGESNTDKINIDVRDEYISIKYNISDGEDSINVEQEFFEDVDEAKKWTDDLISKLNTSPDT